VEFRLLGPVEVWVAGSLVHAGQPCQRAVLAALLVDAGRPVNPHVDAEAVELHRFRRLVADARGAADRVRVQRLRFRSRTVAG
jgi:hypothetical protein